MTSRHWTRWLNSRLAPAPRDSRLRRRRTLLGWECCQSRRLLASTLSIDSVSVVQGTSGTTDAVFTVTLSPPNIEQIVTVDFSTMDGTAVADKDYLPVKGTLTFLPGETTKTITIEVKSDSKKESSETFYVDLFGLSSNALFTKNRGTGTILNDD